MAEPSETQRKLVEEITEVAERYGLDGFMIFAHYGHEILAGGKGVMDEDLLDAIEDACKRIRENPIVE
jgi:hypothetical protein